jgi:cyclic pyranopterin phosphate synthase
MAFQADDRVIDRPCMTSDSVVDSPLLMVVDMNQLSHLDSQGRAKMVDVSGKKTQHRMARAAGMIALAPATRELIRQNQIGKGDVLTVAQLAGIQAAKRTGELIPLCHPLVLDKIDVQLELTDQGVTATSEVLCIGRTGVEMEALVAVSMGLLAVYDMCKAVDKEMRIEQVSLVEKVKRDVADH